MKDITRNTFAALAFFACSSLCGAAGLPGIDISVIAAGGKALKQTKTDSVGNFALGSLPEGPYTIEFRAKNSPELKKKQVTITVTGAKKSGSLEHVSGDHLVAGVALKIEVARGANVTGQVGVGPKMVWIPPILGSHRTGHWVEEDSAEAKVSKTRGDVSKQRIQQLQEKSYNPQG